MNIATYSRQYDGFLNAYYNAPRQNFLFFFQADNHLFPYSSNNLPPDKSLVLTLGWGMESCNIPLPYSFILTNLVRYFHSKVNLSLRKLLHNSFLLCFVSCFTNHGFKTFSIFQYITLFHFTAL